MSKMTKEESERQDRTVQEFKPAFKTMETSISGECETHYTLAKLPATVARDLEQSEQIPESHYKSQVAEPDIVSGPEALIPHQAISAERTKQQQDVTGTATMMLSICATNPCVKYIIEAVKEDKLAGESGAWILSNTIRSVKTPTEELLKELTDLVKAIEHNTKIAVRPHPLPLQPGIQGLH